MKLLRPLSLLLLSASLSLSGQTPDLEKINTEAYLSMMDADNLLKEKKAAEALSFYQKSLAEYERIRQADPNFKSTIVEYRIDLITRKIEDLKQELPDAQRVKPVVDEATLTAEKDFKTLYLQTREKMVQDATRLLELEKRSIQMTAAMREKMQEIEQMQARIRDLETQLKNAKSEQIKSNAALEKEVKDLSRFNSLLQERADKLEIANRQLEADRNDLSSQGKELSGKLAVLEETRKTLEKELADNKVGATQTEQRLILERNQLRDDLQVKNLTVDNLTQKLNDLENRLKEQPLLEETVIELNQRNEKLLAEHESSKISLTNAETNLAAAQKRISESAAKYEEILSKLESARSENEALTSQLTSLQKEKETFAKKIADSEKAVRDIRTDMDKNLKLTAAAEAERAEALNERNGYREEIKNLTREMRELQKEVERLTENEQTSETEKAKLQRELAAKEQQFQNTLANLQALQTAAAKDNVVLKNLIRDSESYAQTKSAIESELHAKTEALEAVRQKLVAAETGLSSETVARKQLELNIRDLEARLRDSQTERSRLELNFQQESEQRKRLEKNAEQQLKSITDRMNEIITLRQQLSELRTQLQKTRIEE